MSTSGREELFAHYRDLESSWQVTDCQPNYAPLVTPTGNAEEAIHRWFHFKEGYSWALLARILKDSNYGPTSQVSVCDPFLGSGTTLVSAIAMAREIGVPLTGLGVERNPAIYTIASAKVAGAIKGQALVPAISDFQEVFWSEYRAQRRRWRGLVTSSVTLNNPDYFPADGVRALLALNRAAACAEDADVRAIFQACVAAAVEPSGRVRRDGRALRFAPNRSIADPVASFSAALDRALTDLSAITPYVEHADVDVVLGDAREVDTFAGSKSFEWMICSPPYPNNIDYTEVYKTESWALEVYNSAEEMKAQRLGTLRSHPSIRFPDEYSYKGTPDESAVKALIDPILASVATDRRYDTGRRQVIAGYADDMLQVLKRLRSVAAAGSRCALVVGNSVHGVEEDSYVIASDLMLGRLGEIAGWHVEEIRVARELRRRGHQLDHLRESVVVLSNG